ncbi:hypothetical protein A9986_03690 [Solibacillus silvestris]|nr:hypothetical protein [Solibacillus silvestris]OBW60285.1 hypothetical protein A9986_03690 [Solibacillus silvestris]
MKKTKWAKGITFIIIVLLIVLYWNIDYSEKNQTDWLLPIISISEALLIVNIALLIQWQRNYEKDNSWSYEFIIFVLSLSIGALAWVSGLLINF